MVKPKLYKKILEENQNSCANPHIGVIIKRRRKNLNMTLEDATKGICCVSYLSKLEHGTIAPKKYVLNEVLERLDMKEENLRSKNEYIGIIQNSLIEYYYGNNNYINEAFLSISDVENIHYTDVIKALYYFVNNEFVKSNESINNALIVKDELDDEELYACIMISTLISIKNNKYREALDIIKNIEDLYMTKIEIEKLKLSLLCKIYQALGMYLPLANTLLIYQDICLKTIDFKGIIEVKKMFGLSLAANNQDNLALEIVNSIKRVANEAEANEYLKQIYKTLKKPNELLKKCKTNNYDKLWAYDLLKEKDKCIELLDKINLLEIDDEITRHYIESLMKKYYENEYFYILYVKDIYYPFLLERGIYEEAKNMLSILFDFLIKESKYKEAIRMLKDFKKLF